MHPFKYAFQISVQFFWQKSWFILYCLNMSSKVIFRKCMIFLRLTFNVNLLMFRWNVLNDRRDSSYTCLASVWTSEQTNWSLMLRTMLSKASKPSKSVAILDSTNISIGYYNKWLITICSPDRPKLSGWHLHWLYTPAPTPACSVHSVCSTLQWFHIVGLWSSMLPHVSSISRCNSSNHKV